MSKKPELSQDQSPKPSPPVIGNWDSAHVTIGAGVAIFHLATERVVLCYHSVKKNWFLPKGRRDANEDTGPAAEREGFEESGYRNRLLPLPIPTRQPKGHDPDFAPQDTPFVAEPVWTQLVPVTRTVQYILFWYIAETVPPELDVSLSAKAKERSLAYQYPPKFAPDTTLAQRVKTEGEGYEPVKHENTGVNADEALYESYLMPVEEALEKLGKGISADVVKKGLEGIRLRRQMEGSL